LAAPLIYFARGRIERRRFREGGLICRPTHAVAHQHFKQQNPIKKEVSVKALV